MPVPTTIDDLSTTASLNSPSGSDQRSQADNYLRAHAAIIKTLQADTADTSSTSKGDALVGVKYEASSAVALNLHNYIEDDGAYNVMGFVAQANKAAIRDQSSAVDVSTAVQAALDAAYGDDMRGLFLPRGLFNVSTMALTMSGNRLTQGLRIRGAGRNATIIKQTGSPTELIKLAGSAPTTGHNAAQIVIEDMTLQGITGAPTAFGITLSSVSDFVLRNLTIEGFTRGVNASSALLGVIADSQVSNCTNGIYTRRQGTSAYCNAITARRVNVTGCSTFGFDIGEANMFVIDNCDIEANGTAANTATGAVMIRNTCDNELGVGQFHILNGTWFEGNLGRGVQVESGMTEFLFSMRDTHILNQESGRALVIGGARRVLIDSCQSPSTNDTWDITCDQLAIVNSMVYTLTDSGVSSLTYTNVGTNAGDYVSGKTGSFTATETGCTTSPTGTVTWVRQGKQITLTFTADITGTSNTTACTLTGVPTELRPAANRTIMAICRDNGTEKLSPIVIGTGGTITLNNGFSGTFTGSGTKGISALTLPPYLL